MADRICTDHTHTYIYILTKMEMSIQDVGVSKNEVTIPCKTTIFFLKKWGSNMCFFFFSASQGAECGGLGTGSVRYMMGSKVTLLGWFQRKRFGQLG